MIQVQMSRKMGIRIQPQRWKDPGPDALRHQQPPETERGTDVLWDQKRGK